MDLVMDAIGGELRQGHRMLGAGGKARLAAGMLSSQLIQVAATSSLHGAKSWRGMRLGRR